MDSKMLAEQFHAAYEELAPSFGYETRKDTKDFDPSTPNGQLMIAVCHKVVGPLLVVYEAALVVCSEGVQHHWEAMNVLSVAVNNAVQTTEQNDE